MNPGYNESKAPSLYDIIIAHKCHPHPHRFLPRGHYPALVLVMHTFTR